VKTFDVAIAGAGLIGGAIAVELARAGLQVGLFDSAEPGHEASWAGAGILSPAPETAASIPMVPLGRASLELYPGFIAAIEESSGQPCGFRAKGTLEAFFSADAGRDLTTLLAIQHGLGLRAEPLGPEEACEMEPALSPDVEAAALRPDEASVDNRLLTPAVLKTAQRHGVEIFSGRGAKEIWRESSRCVGLVLDDERVAAKWTVVAAGCFSAGISGIESYAPVLPAKGQMIALRSHAADIQRVLWSDRIYLVPRSHGRILAGATVEHAGFDKRVTAGAVQKLLSAAIDLVPGLADAQVEETWAGLRPDTPDHLPIPGPTDLEGLVIATGHFRSGILLAPVTAQLVREWITSQRVSLDWECFRPMRFLEARRVTTV